MAKMQRQFLVTVEIEGTRPQLSRVLKSEIENMMDRVINRGSEDELNMNYRVSCRITKTVMIPE